MNEDKKLFKGVEKILKSRKEDLLKRGYLIGIIEKIGLVYDERGTRVYGDDALYMNNSKKGLWQIPGQIADCMIFLSKYNIKNYIEIGTHFGYTFSVMAAYLSVFNSGLKSVTIDPSNKFFTYNRINKIIGIKYIQKNSSYFKNKKFDLCFIDGDHSFEAVKNDYENIGKHSKICIFHDITCKFVNRDGNISVKKFWGELKTKEKKEKYFNFLYHSDDKNIMGIGVRIKR